MRTATVSDDSAVPMPGRASRQMWVSGGKGAVFCESDGSATMLAAVSWNSPGLRLRRIACRSGDSTFLARHGAEVGPLPS